LQNKFDNKTSEVAQQMDLAKHTLANEAKNNNAKCKFRTNIMFIVVKKKNPIKRAN
jgi:hypothetical protein